MAVTFSNRKAFPPEKGGWRKGIVDVTLTGAYPSGGYQVTATALGLKKLYSLMPQQRVIFATIGGVNKQHITDPRPDLTTAEWVNLRLYSFPGGVQPTVSMAAFGAWDPTGDAATANGGGIVGDVTLTEADASMCKVYDAGNAEYNLISAASAGTDYASDYQLFTNTKNDDDAVYFGHSVPFPEIAIDMSATVCTFQAGLDPYEWEYWNGAAWASLSLYTDNTDTLLQDGSGVSSFGRDGAIVFLPPSDWASTEVDGDDAYWIRCRLNTAADLNVVGIMNAAEHFIVAPSNGFEANAHLVVTDIRSIDQTGVGSKVDVFPLSTGGFPWSLDYTTGNHVSGMIGTLLGDASDKFLDASELKVSDNGVFSAQSAAPAGRLAQELYPSAPANNVDYCLFGQSTPFCQIQWDLSATLATYAGDACKWQYWNGAWTDLTNLFDSTDLTAGDGKRPFQEDGFLTFHPPTDWVASTIDGATKYWIRSLVTDGAQFTQVPKGTADKTFCSTPANALVAPKDMAVTKVRVSGESTTTPTLDTKFFLFNRTTGAASAILTWAKEKKEQAFTATLTVNDGDIVVPVVIQADDVTANNPFTNVDLQLTATVDTTALQTGSRFLVWNFTQGVGSGALLWGASTRQASFNTTDFDVAIGDVLGVVALTASGGYVTDGLLELSSTGVTDETDTEVTVGASVLGGGIVLRCEYIGS